MHRHTRKLALGLMIMGLYAISVPPPLESVTAASYCLPADTHTSAMSSDIHDLMTSAQDLAVRSQMHLTQSTSGLVSLVTTSSTCRRGSAVFDSVFKIAKSGSSVYMFKVDSFYAVARKPLTGEVQIGFAFMNSLYRYKGVTIMPLR